MPLYLWLMLGGVAAYLVFQSGKTAATTAAASSTITVTAPNGQIYTVPVDAGLPTSVAQQIQTFFHTASQTDATVQSLSQQLAAKGYTVAAGSVTNVWQMIQQGMGPLVSNSDSSGASQGGSGTGLMGSLPNPFQHATQTQTATAPVLSPTAQQGTLQKPV